MTHTTQTLFGSNATDPTTTTTLIDWSDPDFVAIGLDNPETATPSQKASALALYWLDNIEWRDDSTKGFAPSNIQSNKSIINTRGGTTVNQIARPCNFLIYEADNNIVADPNNTI